MPFINNNEEQIANMKRIILMAFIAFYSGICSMAQLRTVENRPYTDLRPFHFGVLIGTHAQDIEFQNTGITQYIDADGIEQHSHVTVDQDHWDMGFTVGVLGEFRLNQSFQFRIAPAMYFGTRHLTFHNLLQGDGSQDASSDGNTNRNDVSQELKTAYISCAFDLIFAAPRFNNHRPYIMAGLNPMMNLSGNKDEYLRLKKTDLFVELGIGCDFYLPFFKLRPELKFMYGLLNSYDKGYASKVKDKSMLPYTLAAKEAHSKMIALTFYFE